MNNLWKTLWINVENLWNSYKSVDKLKSKIHYPQFSTQENVIAKKCFSDFSTVSTTIIMNVIIF